MSLLYMEMISWLKCGGTAEKKPLCLGSKQNKHSGVEVHGDNNRNLELEQAYSPLSEPKRL